MTMPPDMYVLGVCRSSGCFSSTITEAPWSAAAIGLVENAAHEASASTDLLAAAPPTAAVSAAASPAAPDPSTATSVSVIKISNR
jgi:hypothetical protein